MKTFAFAAALLLALACGIPTAQAQRPGALMRTPLLSQEFRTALGNAEGAVGESRSVAPIVKLFDTYKSPGEVAELEKTLGKVYSQSSGLVDYSQSVLHLGKALEYDLPEWSRLQVLMWRWGPQQQLKQYEAARKDLLRILLICSYHDLSRYPQMENPRRAPGNTNTPQNRELTSDYAYYREHLSYLEFLFLSRYTAIEGLRHLQSLTGWKDDEIRAALEDLSPDSVRRAIIADWLKSENKMPWP